MSHRARIGGAICAHGPVSVRGSRPGRPSSALGPGGSLRRPRRASWSFLAALAAALMLTWPAKADPAIAPDPTITPGAVRTTDAGEICSTGTRQLRHWNRDRDDRILVEYGLPPGPHPDFEIDHLVPLGIGGADSDFESLVRAAAIDRADLERRAERPPGVEVTRAHLRWRARCIRGAECDR